LKSRDFLELVKEAAMATLADAPPDFHLRGSLLQLFYESPHQHYEVWPRPQAGLLELGLHFEGERDDNYRRIAVMTERMPEIAEALGPSVEAEEWTERWTRVHESLPLRPLDEDFAIEVGARLAAFVEALEPLVRPMGPILAPAPRQARARPSRPRRS